MKYKLVNKELRIFSCSVSDLTMQQVASFLDQWEHGAKIGELTLFYEKETDSEKKTPSRDRKPLPGVFCRKFPALKIQS